MRDWENGSTINATNSWVEIEVWGTATTVYVGSLYEQNLNTGEQTSYYFAGSQRVAMWQGGVLYYLHGDHLGSTSLTTNASGNEIANSRQKYYPFGETRSGSSPTDRQFTGQRIESGLGSLYDFNARFMSPALGRFLSADTIVPGAGNPQAFNRYAYGLNNPVKYIDPDGHCPRPPAGMGAVICMALFIQPSEISVGPGLWVLHGDDRSFSSDSPPDRSRGYVYIPIADPLRANDPENQHMNPTGYIMRDELMGNLVEWIEWEGPSTANTWMVTSGNNGEIVVTYDLVLAGGLEHIAPHINGTITFLPDGKGGYSAFGERDGFPWAEAYYYDGNGNVQTIFQQPAVNGDPLDLFAIEGITSNPFHDLGKLALGNGRSRDKFYERDGDTWYWR